MIAAGGGSGSTGIFRVSAAGSLVGLEPPPASRNIEVKPYAIGNLTTDLTASPQVVDEGSGAGGLDVKYGITRNLTADFTLNTDFAQVEVDERQVNLTRFPLFFPEKREFFLEGRGIFGFAQGGVTGRFLRPTASLLGGFFGDVNVPQLFYSRKIGLEEGRVVPIVVGARVTGKVGPFDVGALNIQAGDETVSRSAPTNFTVVRLRRDILARSSVGAMFTNRSVSRVARAPARPTGSTARCVRGSRNPRRLMTESCHSVFSRRASAATTSARGWFALFENLNVITYLARTRVPGPDRPEPPGDTTEPADVPDRARVQRPAPVHGVGQLRAAGAAGHAARRRLLDPGGGLRLRRRADELHSGSLRSTPPPASISSTDSRRRRAFAGLRSR